MWSHDGGSRKSALPSLRSERSKGLRRLSWKDPADRKRLIRKLRAAAGRSRPRRAVARKSVEDAREYITTPAGTFEKEWLVKELTRIFANRPVDFRPDDVVQKDIELLETPSASERIN
jgi:hypothetical protein